MSSTHVVYAQLGFLLVLAAVLCGQGNRWWVRRRPGPDGDMRLEKPCGCFPDWVQCDSGRCIPKNSVCDGHYDCQYGGQNDTSDERGCTPCPCGFMHMPSVNGCYAVVRDNLDWNVAGLRCKSLCPEAHLLIINSAAEQEAIKAMMSLPDSDVADAALARCARYDHTHSCREMFWTAGQRVDLAHKSSPFVWNKAPGSCYNSMSEMQYTYWHRGEPNNAGDYDWNLQPVFPPLPEKCVQLCRGWDYKWNDGVCETPTCSICEVDIY